MHKLAKSVQIMQNKSINTMQLELYFAEQKTGLFVNLGIGTGIGIGADATNAIISSSITPIDTKRSWVVI